MRGFRTVSIPGCFNPRTHTGCDPHKGLAVWCEILFQSTHPHGVRPSLPWTISIDRRFQSTHPHGVRPPFGGTKVETCYSFNPRTHTGCDQFDVCVLHILKRFQSTHPHGVRLRLIPIRSANRLFQSTHPHGVRLWGQGFYSISQSFNPRTHTGCDTLVLIFIQGKDMFQSTHPHGVRRTGNINTVSDYGFNPRTHTGCDFSEPFAEDKDKSFNPRTHTGCDIEHILRTFGVIVFQSTHPHGVRPV